MKQTDGTSSVRWVRIQIPWTLVPLWTMQMGVFGSVRRERTVAEAICTFFSGDLSKDQGQIRVGRPNGLQFRSQFGGSIAAQGSYAVVGCYRTR